MNVQVTQAEIRELFDLEHEVALKQTRIAELRQGIKALLIAKKSVELGRFDVRLIWKIVRNPAWRQIVIDNLGYEFAEECKRKTPINRLCDLRIEEHAVMPLWNGSDEEDAGMSV